MIQTCPRRLSNIYPLRSQPYPHIVQKAKSAAACSGISSNRTFFPPPFSSSTAGTSKEAASTSKMDIFVPSPGLMSAYLAPSPHSSIYEHERSDPTLCGIYTPFSNPSVDSAISEDISGLDDKYEDSSLQNILTSEVLSSLQAPPMDTPSEFTWSGKLDPDTSISSNVENLGSNPTLAQLNMEPDMSLLSGMLNLDQEDNKITYPGVDFLCNDMSSSSSIPCTNSFESSTTEPKIIYETLGSTNGRMGENEIVGSAESSYIKNFSNLKNSFPPRSSQPQKIGVVMPVQKPDTGIKQEEGLGKPQIESPNLHKLLSQHREVKPEICSTPFLQSDVKPQIVPSSSPVKRTYTELVKQEPLSPKVPRKPLVKDESTEEKWKDIENFIHNPQDEPLLKKRRRYNSGSSSHMSDDDDDDDGASSYEGKGDYDDSDDDYSDIDDDLAHISAKDCESLIGMGKKQKQYFWQYNVQSKGPKGTRLKLAVDAPADPHVLNDFEDPVFDECNTSIAGIRHGGKARKGDGNEITPNPRKLFMIGHQLMRLNKQINACQLGADVPAAKRNESRKEKNKLASRACRLKKKAQHEANKIKLYGLEQEHSQLNPVLQSIWPHIREKAKAILGQTDKSSSITPSETSLTSTLESMISRNLKGMIAGHTTDYVNNVILKVESGDNSGGLSIKKSRKT